MQDNSITLSVDTANNGTPANRVYTRHEEDLNRSTYIGSGHSVSSRDMLQFYRTAPKGNGVTRGAAKTSFKVTIDRSVPNSAGDGNVVLPHIIEISMSAPVGVTAADTMELRQIALAILDDDSISGDLNDVLEI